MDAGADPPELVGLVVGGERAAELGVAPVRLLGVGAPGGERVEREELREGRGGRGRGRVGVPRPRALAEAPGHVGDRIARARVPLLLLLVAGYLSAAAVAATRIGCRGKGEGFRRPIGGGIAPWARGAERERGEGG